MASIAEAIFLQILSMWECHDKFSSIYVPRNFTMETCSIGTSSMESSSVSDRVLNPCLEPININSVFVVFVVAFTCKSYVEQYTDHISFFFIFLIKITI